MAHKREYPPGNVTLCEGDVTNFQSSLLTVFGGMWGGRGGGGYIGTVEPHYFELPGETKKSSKYRAF